ncbi:Adhesion G-protein coupled receptor G4 [Lemmus lemmus]
MISRIRMKIHGNLTHVNFIQDQLTLLVKSDRVVVEKLENADDVTEHILNLVNESTALDEEETKIIVSKVTDISNCDDISASLTQMILQIISTVTEKQSDSASNLPPVSNKILRIIERAGHKMEFVGRTANLTVARLALAVLRVDHRFEGMAFSIHASEEVTTPQDLSRSTVDAVNERILVIITYTGCGISSIFLGIAMVTYIAFQ